MSSVKEQDYDQNKYIALDLDQFFRENDEFNMLKTLQEMYVSSYKLELEMKSLVTNELDSVLLCVDTILQMCNLIKGSKNNLDTLVKMANDFKFDKTFEEACKKHNKYIETGKNEIEFVLNEWIQHYSPEMIKEYLYNSKNDFFELKELELTPKLNELIQKSEVSDVRVSSVASYHLQNLVIRNYRLLKSNELVKSYELLFVKAPFLLDLLKVLKATNFNYLKNEADCLCEFYKKKLKSHSLANLNTSSTETLLESVSVLFLLEGKGKDNLMFVMNKRLEQFNISTSSLPLGTESSLKTLFSHFFVNEVLLILLNAFSSDKVNLTSSTSAYFKSSSLTSSSDNDYSSSFSSTTSLCSLSSLPEIYQSRLLEHLTDYSLSNLVELKKVLLEHISSLQINFKYLDLGSYLPTIKSSLSDLLDTTWKKCSTDKISGFMLYIKVWINNSIKIETDLGNFSEYFDNQEFVDSSQYDLDTVVGELTKFLSSEPYFNTPVNEKIDSMLSKVNNQIQSRSFVGSDISSLTVHSVHKYNNKFKTWLKQNGLLETLLLINKLNKTENVDKLYRNISNKYLQPIMDSISQSTIDIYNRTGGDSEDLDQGVEEKMYMLMVAYAVSNLKSYVNECNGYKGCGFTEHLEESALNMCINHYLLISESQILPKFLQRDASVLSFLYIDKLKGVNLDSNTTYLNYKSLLCDPEQHENFYSEFKSLML